jgi:hypothetical protein
MLYVANSQVFRRYQNPHARCWQVSYFHPLWIPLIAKDLAPKPASQDAVGASRALAYSAYRCMKEVR